MGGRYRNRLDIGHSGRASEDTDIGREGWLQPRLPLFACCVSRAQYNQWQWQWQWQWQTDEVQDQHRKNANTDTEECKTAKLQNPRKGARNAVTLSDLI